jgi:hypothetical protein
MVEFYFSEKLTTMMNAVYDYVKLADELVREDYERTYQEPQNSTPSYGYGRVMEVFTPTVGEDDKIPLSDFYEGNDEEFSYPQDINESRFGIGLLLEKERYNLNLKQLFQSTDTLPIIGTWLGSKGELDLSEIYKEFQVELITLYVCRTFFNNEDFVNSSSNEIQNINPNRWDIWNNKYSSNDWYRSLRKLNEKYTELTLLLNRSSDNNIITWDSGSEFHGIYSRIRGSGGGDSARRSFSFIPLWLLLNNIESVYSYSPYPKFEMRNINEGDEDASTLLSQNFEIEVEDLLTTPSLRRILIRRISSLLDTSSLQLFPNIPNSDSLLGWMNSNGIVYEAKVKYRLEIPFGWADSTVWADAEKLGRGGRGIDNVYLRLIQFNTIKVNGELKDSWKTVEGELWSFGLTGQFSINQPDIPNELYQSLQYKITDLISDYLILKPINYPKGIHIKLPPQEE